MNITEFVDYLENVRVDHTLAWMAQGLSTALSEDELAILIEHLQSI